MIFSKPHLVTSKQIKVDRDWSERHRTTLIHKPISRVMSKFTKTYYCTQQQYIVDENNTDESGTIDIVDQFRKSTIDETQTQYTRTSIVASSLVLQRIKKRESGTKNLVRIRKKIYDGGWENQDCHNSWWKSMDNHAKSMM